MRVIAGILFLLLAVQLKAQNDSLQHNDSQYRSPVFQDCKYFHRNCREGLNFSFRTISIVPELQLGDLAYLVGISKFRLVGGEYGGMAHAASASFGYLPGKSLYMAALGVMGSAYIIIPGFSVGLKGIRYFNSSTGFWTLRPELGATLVSFLHFTYGYNFFLAPNEAGLKKGNFNIAFYLPLYPWK